MSRPTRIEIDTAALEHNVRKIRACAPGTRVIAMVKANAYGCGMSTVLPVLAEHVDALGVACLEEAIAVRKLGIDCDCVLFQGIFSQEECRLMSQYRLECVIHNHAQLQWILSANLQGKLKIWIKIDTGMHRLGFAPDDVPGVVQTLLACPGVDPDIILITHLACADETQNTYNQLQWNVFQSVCKSYPELKRSVANSATILAWPEMHADIVRPGIMVYGVSPFTDKNGLDLGLKPVMRFVSVITVLRNYAAETPVGYGCSWSSQYPSVIGVVPVGYGDGYPRHIDENTPVWVNNRRAPIVGRVSMDMLTIDLTLHPDVKLGDEVELWGPHLPIEVIAKAAQTIPYDLLCRVSPRVRGAL